MNKKQIEDAYFDWMLGLVCENDSKFPYNKLLHYLHAIEYVYVDPMDGNRYEDGIYLRYKFGYYREYDQQIIAAYLDVHSCSMMEMLIALSIRCEDIMDDPNYGDRVGQWFWNMITNLGLSSMTDDNFDPDYIDFVISRFENHEYNKDGSNGGLFIIHDRSKDMRSAEIWYQMCWALNEII